MKLVLIFSLSFVVMMAKKTFIVETEHQITEKKKHDHHGEKILKVKLRYSVVL